MQTYIGTKLVSAKPMTRQEYNDFRGWQLPADENGDDAGYLVEYLDGGKPNTEQYAGYVSWSPAEQFEKAYVSVGNVDGLPAHLVRVAGELSELADRMIKLDKFIAGDLFASLPADERVLLQEQRQVMEHYAIILNTRLSRGK